eukprot:TRINITY_DN8309_c0_g3_i4.p1 TRINITY_DN8309_c0_g3~~TRINITY_DN8309_c0_g3_i4.p1  ORF type:complete len:312 (+),score=90.04 TRINITY_DN8309_c0_g3_i4:194-1129(+)
MRQAIMLVLLLAFAVEAQKIVTDFPVIGILTQPLAKEEKEFISAQYPIYLGGSGAKIVPVSYKLPREQLLILMEKLNGLFITGGTADFAIYDDKKDEWIVTPFGKAAQEIVSIAKQINDDGRYFPIWGTCMGFQLLAFAVSGDLEVPRKGCNCKDYNAKLIFTREGKKSSMFSAFTREEVEEFTKRGMTYNYHEFFVDITDFARHRTLRDFFRIISYSMDKDGKRMFISAMEGKKYPFYGTQFHPELNQYSMGKRLPGPENVKLAQRFGNFFVNETRKSKSGMETDEVLEKTIWNTPITKLGEANFVYVFT